MSTTGHIERVAAPAAAAAAAVNVNVSPDWLPVARRSLTVAYINY